MKRRIVSLLLIVSLALVAGMPAYGAMSLSNFSKTRTYRGEFSDLPPTAWYFEGIRGVYEYGIMDGQGGGVFHPSGTLTIAETIKIAASLHKGYHTGSMDFEPGLTWYAPYVEYALANGIPVGSYRNMGAVATRSDFALIIAGSLPDEALTPINRVADGAIPDVFESYSYGQAVYKLYRAGVLAGSDGEGRFFPGRTITRAETAAVIMRIVDANMRVTLTLAPVLTAEEIYKLASPAVFFVEMLDDEGKLIKTGSGFFISESGLAITNYHVVIGATAMRITTDDGSVFQAAGIYDYDWKMDAALVQIEGHGFPYLELADPTRLLTGATVYALGSPLRLQASFSRGIVSQALREIDGALFIQLDAAISSGSSGGALLDSTGRVIGVTSATVLGAQNINLAVPINFFAGLSLDSYVTLKSILIPTEYYKDYFPAPDFGAFFDMPYFYTSVSRDGISYSYRLSDMPRDADEMIDEYTHLVQQNLFDHSGFLTKEGHTYSIYINSAHGVMLVFGKDEVRNHECFTITVS